jgi:hypothetical protein
MMRDTYIITASGCTDGNVVAQTTRQDSRRP